jgi:AbrB family looped-hinge helix DNA binding protein
MARTKVTAKYQVTIPREVREKVEVRPGEVVSIEALSGNEILLKVYPRKADPLSVLIGKRGRLPEVPVEELEEAAESR